MPIINGYLRDILSQPACLRKALSHYTDYAEAMEDLARQGFDRVLFTGMGSSHFCAFGAGIALNRSGPMCAVESASHVLHYGSALLNGRTLVVMISQSGESAEIVRLIERTPEDCHVVAVTNDAVSTLGRRGNTTLELRVEPEESVTTRTYLASLILVTMLVGILAGERYRDLFAGFNDSIGAMERYLKEAVDKGRDLVSFIGTPSALCLIGRGYSMSSVAAGTLFLREVAKFPALDFDAGEFRHGPMEMVDEGFVGIVFAPEGPTFGLNRDLALDLAEKGGRAVLVTNGDPGDMGDGVRVVGLPGSPEPFNPLVEILPVQLIANGFAECRGFIPGRFRWCSKVTANE